MTTALALIQGALRNINSYQSGDQLAAPDANDCLEVLNDLLDSWSTDSSALFGSDENILYYTGGKYQYTIGIDPTGGTTADFSIARPLRITNAFTRINTQGTGYDYPIEIISQDRYVEYGLKSIPYPWPTQLWYNTGFPFGVINFYGAPVGGGELHLFTDTILSNLTLNQTLSMPQGYARAIKWMLAREICGVFGFPLTPQIEKLSEESWKMVKALNSQPVPESKIDCPSGRSMSDAGGILYGWYR
jgi:hypothetical protein